MQFRKPSRLVNSFLSELKNHVPYARAWNKKFQESIVDAPINVWLCVDIGSFRLVKVELFSELSEKVPTFERGYPLICVKGTLSKDDDIVQFTRRLFLDAIEQYHTIKYQD